MKTDVLPSLNGTSRLPAEHLKSLQERHLLEQEQQAEQLRLSYIAARAAVEAVRAEIEGK